MPPYSNALTWQTFLGLSTSTDQTNPTNPATSSVNYDQWGRPTSSVSVHGATTTYTYTVSPPTVTASIDGRWTTTTFDGLGRVIKVVSGNGSTSVSEVDTVYGPSGLDPLGKVMQRSVAYTPGGTPAWTVYNHDGLGRTTSIVAPDGASTTTYSYLANTVTATDPAGNWKTFTMDAVGNILTVTEPNPAGGTFTTNYTYTVLNQLAQVQMMRGSSTQTRTWTYNGAFLTQATTPETGTTRYYYNSNGTLAYKVDARNQKIAYTYDGDARVTMIQHYPAASGQEDTCQRVMFTWDYGSPYVWGWGFTNATGRIALITYYTAGCVQSIQELYSYDPSSLVTGKQINVGTYTYTQNSRLTGLFGYDTEGRLTSVTYPNSGPQFQLSYDIMGRLNGMTDNNNNTWVSGVSYGPAGELLQLGYSGYTEKRSYNTMKQLTGILTSGGSNNVNFAYSFSGNQNNGKITQMQDIATGETIQYAYDSLLRLQSATSNQNWSQGFVYDGFGNLTNVNASNAPGLAVNVNAATNQLYSDTYDANGNDTSFGTYDVENRLISANGVSYGYAPDGRRVYKQPTSGPAEYYFWAPNGQRLGTYTSTNPQSNGYTTASTNVYFGGRLLQAGGNTILVDRLGSNVSNGKRYYPYGMEKPSATANEVEKFTGYFRDAETGLDYAQQRYEEPGYGRFLTPDRAGRSAAVQSPLSFNGYSYAGGDPVNRVDPTGSDWCEVPADFYPAYSGPCNGSGPNGICWTTDPVDTGPDCSIVNVVDYETILALIGVGGTASGGGGGGGGGATGCPVDAFLGPSGCLPKVPVRPVQNPSPPVPRQPQQGTCSAELTYTPVTYLGVTVATHAQVTVTDWTGASMVLQGEPDHSYAIWGNLVGVFSPSTVAGRQWGLAETSAQDPTLWCGDSNGVRTEPV